MAIANTALLPTASVKIFANAEYVSETGAASIKAGLESFGFPVSTFDGTSSAAWTAALAGPQVLVIPDMFWGLFDGDEAEAKVQ